MQVSSHKLVFIILFVSLKSFGGDFSYSHSQSDTANGNALSISGKVSEQLKLGIAAAASTDTSGSTDSKTSYFKISSKYKLDVENSLNLDLKKSDESYFFEGQSLSAKYSYRFKDIQAGPKQPYLNKINFKIEAGKKSYSLDTAESITFRKITFGYDRDFQQGLSLGFEFSNSNYLGAGSEIKKSLLSDSSTNSDITSYVTALVKSTSSLYIEKVFEDSFTLGISISRDLPLSASGTQSDGAEIYTDYQVNDEFSLSFSYGKTSINTTSPTSASSFGFLYSY